MAHEPEVSRLDAIATQWSLVQAAHTAGQPQNATAARQALVLRYAKSIRKYVGGIVKKGDDADELAQDAVMRLMSGDFAGADPNRGRFRDLLKTAVRNMVHNHWAKSNRRKTSDFDPDLLGTTQEDPAWDTAWRTNVLDHTWAALKDYETKNPNTPTYTLLKLRTDHPDDTSEVLAEKLSAKLGSPVKADACRQLLRRARLRFAELLLKEISMGLTDASPARVQEELAALGLLEYVKDFLPADWATNGVLKE